MAKKASAAGACADVSNRYIYPKNKNVVPKVDPKEKRKTRKNDKMTKEKPAARGYARKWQGDGLSVPVGSAING